MKRVRPITLLWVAASGLLVGQETLVYEAFDYLRAGCLAGGATGTGWAGAWAEAGEGGDAASELILAAGSFPVPPDSFPTTGNHVDLNQNTGERRITRRMGVTLGGGSQWIEHSFRFVLDLGPALGVDFAGIELSHSDGGPVVFLGKPPGAGPFAPGILGMDVYGQGFTGTGVAGSGQKLMCLRWRADGAGADILTLEVLDAVTGELLGTASQAASVAFNQATLVARRDLAAGGAIPAFDELRAASGPADARVLTVASVNPAQGVPAAISVADLNGNSSGPTPLERVYPFGIQVTVTVPTTVDGNSFVKWTLDGADYSARPSVTVSMSGDRALTAVYQTPARTLTIAAAGAGGPVDVDVSPPDLDGLAGGIAPLSRVYPASAVVSLAVPETVAETGFVCWKRAGSVWSEQPAIEVTVDADMELTAVYDYPFDEAITGVTVGPAGTLLAWSAVGGRRYVVEASDDLQVFAAVSPEIEAEGQARTSCVFLEPLSPLPARRFYRIRVVPP